MGSILLSYQSPQAHSLDSFLRSEVIESHDIQHFSRLSSAFGYQSIAVITVFRAWSHVPQVLGDGNPKVSLHMARPVDHASKGLNLPGDSPLCNPLELAIAYLSALGDATPRCNGGSKLDWMYTPWHWNVNDSYQMLAEHLSNSNVWNPNVIDFSRERIQLENFVKAYGLDPTTTTYGSKMRSKRLIRFSANDSHDARISKRLVCSLGMSDAIGTGGRNPLRAWRFCLAEDARETTVMESRNCGRQGKTENGRHGMMSQK
ncbi:hypothetical protein B0H13DRAFT_1853289 [Mycena leptocephala]|nr:hypothetical protein B0H13DRAFT_1853289 [Mycena leptocephala]